MQGESMNLALELTPEQLVDQAVLRYQILTLEVAGYNDYLEVPFRSRRHVVLPALVDYLQVQGFEAVGELLFNSLLNAHGTVH